MYLSLHTHLPEQIQISLHMLRKMCYSVLYFFSDGLCPLKLYSNQLQHGICLYNILSRNIDLIDSVSLSALDKDDSCFLIGIDTLVELPTSILISEN